MRQAEAILARFPGPVSLFIKRRSKFVSFVICFGFTVFFAWLVFGGYDSSYRSYDWIMIPISLVLWPALAIRAAIMLLVQSIGSLTLDADGMVMKLFFQSPRISWQDVVREFRDETTFLPGKVGGPLRQVTFEVIVPSAWRRVPTRAKRALHGNFELPIGDLAWLMNEWRQRALALGKPPAYLSHISDFCQKLDGANLLA